MTTSINYVEILPLMDGGVMVVTDNQWTDNKWGEQRFESYSKALEYLGTLTWSPESDES